MRGFLPKNKLLITLIVIFLLSHGISISVQLFFPKQEKDHLNKHKTEITVADKQIEISYYLYGSSKSTTPVIIYPNLLDSKLEHNLAEELAKQRTVIIPDYPSHAIDGSSVSHSNKSRAEFVRQLMNNKNYPTWYSIGVGYGGVVMVSDEKVLEENRSDSWLFIQSMGVQEYQFLGNYHLNRIVYSLLYPVHGFIKYVIPHAGWYHQQPVKTEFIKSLRELDQRDIRDQFVKVQSPAMIINFESDRQGIKATGSEIYRLIPQSKHLILDDSITEQPAELLTPVITNFLVSADKDELTKTDDALIERVEESELPFDETARETAEGLTLLILMLLIVAVTLISEDLACIGAGLAAASGIIDFWYAVLACYMGILTADISVYWLGRLLGRPALEWIPFRWIIKEKDILWAEHMFESKGMQIIFGSRFLPGTRFPVYFTSGMVKANFWIFSLYFIGAISLWTPFFVGLSTLIGHQLLGYFQTYQEYAVYVTLFLILLLYLLFKVLMPLATIKGRKEFAVKMIRLKQKYFNKS